MLSPIFVPNQPDQIFGDISEPLPNGYVLTGLAKMSDYAFIDSKGPAPQPKILGGIHGLEVEGPIVYGAYSHPVSGFTDQLAPAEIGYFIFDTRNGEVRNLKTLQELESIAGRRTHMVESLLFRSQEPARVRLRKVENAIYVFPPVAVLLFFIYRLIRVRVAPN